MLACIPADQRSTTTHIGNLRRMCLPTYGDTLEYAGYEVKQIINITDVGHLVGDGDEGGQDDRRLEA